MASSDLSSSSSASITALLRPRYISVALIAVAVAATYGYGLWHNLWSFASVNDDEVDRRAAGSLHRSNAVRRSRHAATDSSASQNTAAGTPPAPDPSADPPADENATRTGGGGAAAEEPAETVVDDAEADERWLDDTSQAVMHRAGQNIVSLLFRVSEDNARRSSYVHRGCACNACGIVPIRGIRYRCANCADFDLCETCESQGLHIKTHIFYKVKVPAPPFGPRQMQPVWYPGDPDQHVRSLNKNLINRLSRETGFERQELEAFWEQWTYMANTEWRDDPDELYLAMDRKTFERCLVPSGNYQHTAPNLIHDRMFAFYDTNNDDLIGFSEFLHGLSYRKRKDKLRKIFDGYDTDRDGYVSRRDFLRFFRAYYVLYKQMQRDILDGLHDQVMSSIETHQLVNGRQPLSSLFGRDGRVPPADLQRMMAGKVINNETGALIVEDSPNGVVADNSNDTENRQDLMARLFTRWRRHVAPSGIYEDRYHAVDQNDATYDVLEDGLAATNYWDALLNPPATVQELPSLLLGQVDPSSQLNDNNNNNNNNNNTTHGDGDGDGDGDDDMFVPSADTYGTSSPEPNTANRDDSGNANGSASGRASHGRNQHSGAGTGFAVLDSRLQDQYNPAGTSRPSQFNHHYPPTPGQIRAQYEASTRAQHLRAAKTAARRKLHNRWVRRNFYLDEEEGATAPDGWGAESDILAGAPVSHAAGEPSSASASSSTARTELPSDTFGGENVQSSSLPEAERDAGREVLYQVMQQSFNEMLDTLFVEKENLAIAAAETKDKRDKYRHLFAGIKLSKERSGAETETEEPAEQQATKPGSGILTRPIQQMDLDELLNIAGYRVDESAYTNDARAAAASQQQEAATERYVREGAPEPEAEAETVAQTGDTGAATDDTSPGADEEEENEKEEAPLRQGDPTMPQFRPNSETEYRALMEARAAATPRSAVDLSTRVKDEETDAAREAGHEINSSEQGTDKGTDKDKERGKEKQKEKQKEEKKLTSAGAADKITAPDIPLSELRRWKRLDIAEREAQARGGWGKLSYSEFEDIFRREEQKSNRLDYLGSWIDFCIP